MGVKTYLLFGTVEQAVTVRCFYLQFASIFVHVKKVDDNELLEGTSELCTFEHYPCCFFRDQSCCSAFHVFEFFRDCMYCSVVNFS